MNDSNVQGMLDRAAKYCDDGQLEEAHALASMVVDERPEEPRAAFILGNCHMKAKRPETAYYLYRYIQKFPAYRDSPQLFDQIGMSLAEMGDMKGAESWYRKSDARGGTVCTYASLASLYTKMGDPQKAVECAEKALKLSPDSQEAKWNGALAMLKLKQWRKGWEWHDTTLGTKIRPKPPSLNGVELPWWDGEGGNVLIYGEQGLGDELMFASILPDAIKKANRVVCAVDPKLIGLLSRSFPEAVFVSRRGKDIVLPEPIDLTHIYSIASLGRLFRNDDSDFPGTPYLVGDPQRRVMCRALLDNLGPGKKIGVMWKGGVGGLDEKDRTVTLNDLDPVLSKDAVFVSLSHLPDAQKECANHYRTTGINVHHFPFITQSNDYDDTAALISELDAVVCMTSTAAHCASALGVDTHVLVQKMPYWRYLDTGSKMPWYQAMTMYRQTHCWPVEEVAGALFGPR